MARKGTDAYAKRVLRRASEYFPRASWTFDVSSQQLVWSANGSTGRLAPYIILQGQHVDERAKCARRISESYFKQMNLIDRQRGLTDRKIDPSMICNSCFMTRDTYVNDMGWRLFSSMVVDHF